MIALSSNYTVEGFSCAPGAVASFDGMLALVSFKVVFFVFVIIFTNSHIAYCKLKVEVP